MKDLKNQNNVLFKMSKQCSSRSELNKTKNIKKAIYDSSSSGDSIVSREFYSSYSSIFSPSD